MAILENRNYIVYAHIFPNGKRYVGITKQDAEKRWKNGAGYRTQSLMKKAINKYGWHNVKHKILYTNLTKEEAEQKEIEIIKGWKTNEIDYGYNADTGGNGSPCHVVSEETKENISRKIKDIWDDEEKKTAYKKAMKKKWENLEYRRMMSESHKGKQAWNKGIATSEEVKRKLRKPKPTLYKKVSQYSIDGEKIATYISITIASKENGITTSQIVECCKGKRQTAHGYVWKYE